MTAAVILRITMKQMTGEDGYLKIESGTYIINLFTYLHTVFYLKLTRLSY